ncbi:MAG: class I SAM-dependent methyltransferase [Actinobacteria bacterium]|nr:class I SAM-dependent methyltransferase [Actinomycetota bacterium]
MRPLLTPFLRRRRNKISARYAFGDILDLGCGCGESLAFIKNRGRYLGIDREPYSFEGLPPGTDTSNATFILCDLDNPDIPINGLFDSVLLVAVMEHLENHAKLLQWVRGVIKPGGNLIITTPPPYAAAVHVLLARIGLTHKDAVSQHHCFFDKEDMSALLSSAGFDIKLYKRFEFGLNQLFVCQPRLQ